MILRNAQSEMICEIQTLSVNNQNLKLFTSLSIHTLHSLASFNCLFSSSSVNVFSGAGFSLILTLSLGSVLLATGICKGSSMIGIGVGDRAGLGDGDLLLSELSSCDGIILEVRRA